MPYRVVVLDDHPMVISGISNLILSFSDFKMEASFTKSDDLLVWLEKNKTDLIITDIFLQENNGIDLCKHLKVNFPDIVVLGMSSQSERSIIMQFIQNGGNGFFLKSISMEELGKCLYRAMDGEIVFSEEVKKSIHSPKESDFKNIPLLSRREKDIVRLLTEGKSTKEIADELYISFLTVQTHRRNILNKYEVKNVAELINYVIKNKLI